MLRARLVNLTAMATMVLCLVLFPRIIGPALPDPPRLAGQAVGLVFVAGWLVLLFRRPPDHASLKSEWPLSSPFVVWGGLVTICAAYWLWMPHADEGMLLMATTFTFATVTVYLLTAIETPPVKTPLARWAPVVLPVSMTLYFLTHPSRFSWPLAWLAASYAYIIWMLRAFVQDAVDRAHAAQLASETALEKVAAERDLKTRFLASASHDLHQPVLAARLFFDQALNNPSPALRAQAKGGITAAFDSIESLLRQMLDHLRLEAGAIAAHPERLAVASLINQVAEMNAPAAEAAGVEIRAVGGRLVVEADPALMERALGNLVGNAIRHAKGTRVLIGTRRAGERVRIWVIDDGEGVHGADAPQLFDDYVQGAHGDELRGGFGLGLASTRRLMRLMDGGVGLERRWTKGAAFWLELPAA